MSGFVKNVLAGATQRHHYELLSAAMDLMMRLATEIHAQKIAKEQIAGFCESENNKKQVRELLAKFKVLSVAYPQPELDLLKSICNTPDWDNLPEGYRYGILGLANYAIKCRKNSI